MEQRRDMEIDFVFNRWEILNQICLKFFKFLKRIIYFLIYIFCGYFIIQTKYSIMKLEISTWSIRIYIILFSLTYSFLIIGTLFIQIIINIIILILYLLDKEFSYFIKDFKHFLFMKSHYAYMSVFYSIYSFSFNSVLLIFGGDIFLYFHKKIRNSNFVSSCHYFITIIHMFIYFSYNIVFGTIKYLLYILFGKIEYITKLENSFD